MSSIKIGIVGIGNMGSAHLNCIYQNEIKGMTVKAVCDIDSKHLKEIGKKYPCVKLYNNYREMLEDSLIDAVLIATPHPLHGDMIIEAFKHNKHVLVEKPIDITVSKALAVNECAEKNNKIFAIMFNQRTNELFTKAKQIVESGKLGDLKRSVWIITNWYRTQHYYDSGSWRATWAGEGGGVLLNQAPHNLDLWQWICGMPKSITAFCNVAKFHNIEVEDEATIYTEYENGATGTFITSTGDFPGTNRLEIDGTKGKIVIENGILKFWNLKEDERFVCENVQESFYNIDYDYEEYSVNNESGHKGILQNFANAILNGEKLIAPGIDAINQLTISNAAYLSQWLGNKKIKTPFDYKTFDLLLLQKSKTSHLKKNTATNSSNQYNDRWKIRW